MALITGLLHTPGGALYAGIARFVSTPPHARLVTSCLVTAQTINSTVTSGALSVTLEAGTYQVVLEGTRPFLIAVPETTGTLDIRALITSGSTPTPVVAVGMLAGGLPGQVYVKKSVADWDVEWGFPGSSTYVGGTIGMDGSEAWLSPYSDLDKIVTTGGTAVLCGAAGIFTLLATGRQQVMPGTTTVSRIRILCSTTVAPNLTSIKFVYGEINSTGTFKRNYISAELIDQWPTTPATALVELSFPSVSIPVGSICGVRVTGPVSGTAGSNWTKMFQGTPGQRIEYYSGDPADLTAITTTKANTHGWGIHIYGNWPAMAGMGDSNFVGQFETHAGVRANTVSYQIEAAFGMGCLLGGVGGATSAQILTNLVAGPNIRGAQQARVIRCSAGTNDVYQGVSKTTYLTNVERILDLLQGPRQYVVWSPIPPWTNGTNEQMTTVDDWNASVADLIATKYTNVLLVDDRAILGQFRAGGTAGNLWDIKPAYLYTTDGLGVHFNAAGYAAREVNAAALATTWFAAKGIELDDEEVQSDGITSVTGEAPLRFTSGTKSPKGTLDSATDTARGTMSAAHYSKVEALQSAAPIGEEPRWMIPYVVEDRVITSAGTGTQIGDPGVITIFGTKPSQMVPGTAYYNRVRVLCATIADPAPTSVQVVNAEKLSDGTIKILSVSINLVGQWPQEPTVAPVELIFPAAEFRAGTMVGLRVRGPTPGSDSAWTRIYSGLGRGEYYVGDASNPNSVETTKMPDHGWFLELCAVRPPSMAILGDSNYLGQHGTEASVPGNLVAAAVEAAFGLGCINTGLPGGATANTLITQVADLTSVRGCQAFRLIRLGVGHNDIYTGVSEASFLGRMQVVLDALQSFNQYVLVDYIGPWTNGTNGQMQTRDTWNASLAALIAGRYTNVLLMDHSSIIGQFRTGGDALNLWDIKTAFLYTTDGIGLHLNPAGLAARETNAATLTIAWLATKGLTLADFAVNRVPVNGSPLERVYGTSPIVVVGGNRAAGISITAATTSAPGTLAAADKTKLEALIPRSVLAAIDGSATTDAVRTKLIAIETALRAHGLLTN